MFSSSSSSQSMDKMPGPKEIMGRGHVTGDLALYQLALHKEYGSIVKFKLNTDTWAVSTTDAKVLKTCAKIFVKPEKLYEFLEPIMGNLLFLPEDETKKLRELMIHKFSPELVKYQLGFLTGQLSAEIDNWLKSSIQSNGVIALQEKVKAHVMRMTVTLVFGQDFLDSATLGKTIHHILQESIKHQYNKDDQDFSELNAGVKYLNDTVDQLIEEHKNSKEKKPHVFLDDVLEYSDDPVVVRNVVKEVLMAGYHTTASTVCWALYSIANHPEIAKKVYAEIDQVLNTETIDAKSLSKLSYLALVIKETLRMYPAGPYTARKADEDLEMAGYIVSKDTPIFYPIWAVHMNPEYWANPEKFDPDRFKRPFNKEAYLPFGFGTRNCPGTTIANTEILLILSLVLKKLTLTNVADFKPEIRENFVLISANDIQLKISQRKLEPKQSLSKGLVAVGGTFAITAAMVDNDILKLICFILAASVLYYSYRNMSRSGITFHQGPSLNTKPLLNLTEERNIEKQYKPK